MTSSLKEFQSLPTAIFLLIQTYIPSEYKNFINTCRSLLLIKSDTVYYKLNQPTSFRFCQDESFRQLIYSKVKYPRYQISINLRQFVAFCDRSTKGDSTSVQPLYLHARNVNRLKLQGLQSITELTPFENIPELWFYGFENVTSTEGLTNVEMLSLNTFQQLQLLTYLPNLRECILINCPLLENIESLSHVKILYFEDCRRLLDIRCLGSYQHRLSIINCGEGNIIDISTLGQVKNYLELRTFHQIVDISHLRNIPEIKLFNFRQPLQVDGLAPLPGESSRIQSLLIDHCDICNPNALSAIPILKLQFVERINKFQWYDCQSIELISCRNVKQIPYIPTLRKIRIKATPISSIEMLQHLSVVILERLDQKIDLSPLARVPTVQLIECQYLTLDGLGQNQSVSVIGMTQYLNLSLLSEVPNVKVINCITMKAHQWEAFAPSHSLTIEHSRYLQRTIAFGHLYFLQLSYCHILTKLEGLENVHTVIIEYCPKLEDLSGLRNNMSVKLYKCESITDVTPLLLVEEVRISYCSKIKNIEILYNLIKYVTK